MIKVLIADDEELSRSVIRHILDSYFKEGILVFEAGTGKEAVCLVLAEKIDIAFLDISMPGMDGLRAGREIKELFPGCSVIFLTAYAQFSYAKQAISMGAAEYLVKPVDARDVVSVINTELFKRHARTRREYMEETRRMEQVFLQQEAIPSESRGIGQVRASKIAQDAKRIIDAGYMKEISVEEIADQFQISVTYFNRIFKQFYEVTGKEYIINVRVEKAKEYLKNPNVSIKEAGAMVGYGDSNYFSRIFKKKTGLTPIEYRNQSFFMPDSSK